MSPVPGETAETGQAEFGSKHGKEARAHEDDADHDKPAAERHGEKVLLSL
jgi:hypothetical protein